MFGREIRIKQILFANDSRSKFNCIVQDRRKRQSDNAKYDMQLIFDADTFQFYNSSIRSIRTEFSWLRLDETVWDVLVVSEYASRRDLPAVGTSQNVKYPFPKSIYEDLSVSL